MDHSERMSVSLRLSPHGFIFDSRRKGGCLASCFASCFLPDDEPMNPQRTCLAEVPACPDRPVRERLLDLGPFAEIS